jgi:CBS domain-containing protein
MNVQLATRHRLPGGHQSRRRDQAGAGTKAVRKVSTVREVMTSWVRTVTQDTPATELIREMSEYHVSALPVVDDKGRLLGIVSEADLLARAKRLGTDAAAHGAARSGGKAVNGTDLVAGDLMTSPVITIGLQTSISEAARLLQEHRIKRLIVVGEDDQVAGIASRIDLLKAFVRDDAAIMEYVETIARDVLQLADCGLQVDRGTVSIEGRVNRKSDADRLLSLVARLPGVVAVHGEIQYGTDDTRMP